MQTRSQASKSTASVEEPILSSQLQPRPFGPVADAVPGVQTQPEGSTFDLSNVPVLGPEVTATAGAPSVQAKLSIGQPNDQYEQEADRVAAQVVEQINTPQAPSTQSAQGAVQREAMPEEEEMQMKPIDGGIQREEALPEEEAMPEEAVQMKPIEGAIQREGLEEEDPLQAKLESTVQREPESDGDLPDDDELQMKSMAGIDHAESGDMAASPSVESSIQGSRGGGSALEGGIQASMEQAFGADFSGVRVHADSQSDQLNQSIGARAFTTGQDVFFRQGAYDPGSRGGQELLAHELTHVVQQNGSAVQAKEDR